MQNRPSTAPIALLSTAGVVCLCLTAVLPTSTEVTTTPEVTTVGEPISTVVTTSTSSGWTAAAFGLLALAVLSFAAAARLAYRRRSSRSR